MSDYAREINRLARLKSVSPAEYRAELDAVSAEHPDRDVERDVRARFQERRDEQRERVQRTFYGQWPGRVGF